MIREGGEELCPFNMIENEDKTHLPETPRGRSRTNGNDLSILNCKETTTNYSASASFSFFVINWILRFASCCSCFTCSMEESTCANA